MECRVRINNCTMGPYLLRLVLTASFASFVLTFTLPNSHGVHEGATNDGDGETQKNFKNLFNSISKNDATNGDTYRQILRREVSEEQQNFGALKEDLQMARARNRNANIQVNSNIITLAKREASETSETTTSEVPDTAHRRIVEAILQLWFSQRAFIKNVRANNDELRRLKLVNLNRVNDMIDKIEHTIQSEIELLQPFVDKPEDPEDLKKIINKEVFAQVLQNWGTLDEYFKIYELEGAVEMSARIRHEFKSAEDDMRRRWQLVESRIAELEEQQEDEEYRVQCLA